MVERYVRQHTALDPISVQMTRSISSTAFAVAEVGIMIVLPIPSANAHGVSPFSIL